MALSSPIFISSENLFFLTDSTVEWLFLHALLLRAYDL